METIECVHIEHMKSGENHAEVGVCQHCGQTVVYDRLNLKSKPTLTKLGRKDGKIVLPRDVFNVDLNGKDLADLRMARIHAAESDQSPATVPAADISGRPGADNPKARLQWYQDNKKAMITDLINLGNEAFLKKWGVSNRMISHLKADKYYKKLAQKTPPAKPKKQAGRLLENITDWPSPMPSLPPWSEDWTPEIKLAWLEIYARLVK